MSSLFNVSNDPNVKILPADHTRRNETPRSETVNPEPVDKPAYPWWTIAICGLLMVLYTGSPIDFIPDFIPILGQLDDLLVDAGLLGLIARAVLRYHALKRLSKGGATSMLKTFFTQKLFGRFFRRR
jgi:uncharacterized membrane protein YkvA (DUF1232 family)